MRKARHDAKVAERDAEDAEDYAVFVIDFAYSTIEEAEYAGLGFSGIRYPAVDT